MAKHVDAADDGVQRALSILLILLVGLAKQ
jgi:hypothetical protein